MNFVITVCGAALMFYGLFKMLQSINIKPTTKIEYRYTEKIPLVDPEKNMVAFFALDPRTGEVVIGQGGADITGVEIGLQTFANGIWNPTVPTVSGVGRYRLVVRPSPSALELPN